MNNPFRNRPSHLSLGLGGRLLLALATALTAVWAVAPQRMALADKGGEPGHTFDVTFTKWITSLPADPPSLAGVSMAGIVGGDVGDGVYVGTVLDDDLSLPGFWLGHAQYGVFGRKHAFIAEMHVTEDDTVDPPTAVLTGIVRWGWQKGARVKGEYTVLADCTIPTPGNVFDTLCVVGTLHIHTGRGRGH
jgi:hypothetical protein